MTEPLTTRCTRNSLLWSCQNLSKSEGVWDLHHVRIMQIISERSGKLLMIILYLLPSSVTSIECSTHTKALEAFSCPSYCRNASTLFRNGSEECRKVRIGPAVSDPSFVTALVYILIDLAPLMIYFPVLILFNINLASGPGQSFLFFYQTLTTATNQDLMWGLLTMQSPINDFGFPHTLPYIALQYCKLGAVLVAIVMTVVLVKCNQCPCAYWRRPWAKIRRSVRHFREKHAQQGTVLNGLCSIAILTYGFVIQHSFSILRPTSRCCPSGAKYCAYHCTELVYSDYRFSLFVAAALICLALALLLPLLLLYYPCVPVLMQRVTKRSPQFMTCHKLAPVLDVFQSAYKPKLRFFAAFPLLYRFVIWFLFSILSAGLERNDILIVITFVFIVILAIHSLVQPYSKPKHNYIETLFLVNLVLITMMLLIIQLAFISSFRNESKLSLLQLLLATTLMYLPILICVGYFFWKCKCCKRCRAACCKRVKRNRRRSADQSKTVQAKSSEVSFSEVYFDMGEVGQLNQDWRKAAFHNTMRNQNMSLFNRFSLLFYYIVIYTLLLMH